MLQQVAAESDELRFETQRSALRHKLWLDDLFEEAAAYKLIAQCAVFVTREI